MSTELKITRSNLVNANGEVSFSKNLEKNELNFKAQGGTELMQSWLYSRLPDHLKDAFQIIPSRVRHIDKDRPVLYWLHDLADDPEVANLSNPEYRKLFSKLIYVSNWQLQQYALKLGVPYQEGVVLKNAIEPIPEHKKPDGGIKIIYHTTPHRGLNILVPVFHKLCEFHDDIELDVYSSFKIYGWEERDAQFQKLFDICKQHPKINYRGSVSNDQIRKALQDAHIFAYPSIWQETSCIAGIEALSAGCMMVNPNLAALPETTANFSMQYQYQEDIQVHANLFFNVLNNAINIYKKHRKDDNFIGQQRFQKAYYDTFYSWDVRIEEWKNLMEGILASRQ